MANTTPSTSKSSAPAAAVEVSKKIAAAMTVEDYTHGWEEDVRSLPMYNVRECSGPIVGHLIDAQILQAAAGDGDEREEGNRAFSALVVKLTRPCMALVNGTRETVPAGKEIYVHAAAIEDLYRVALDPHEVIEYMLTPDYDPETKQPKQIKLKSGFQMPVWKRTRNPVAVKRSSVTKRKPSIAIGQYARALQLAKVHGIEAMYNAATDVPMFDPATGVVGQLPQSVASAE